MYEDGRPAKGVTVSALPIDRGMGARVQHLDMLSALPMTRVS
jgi:hypothetical protein